MTSAAHCPPCPPTQPLLWLTTLARVHVLSNVRACGLARHAANGPRRARGAVGRVALQALSFCYNGWQLPSLIILGAQKCDTTSFWNQLKAEWDFGGGTGTANDGLGYSTAKEHHFFDVSRRSARGLEHYASGFPPCGQHAATVDATPNYFFPNGVALESPALRGRLELVRSL